MQKNRWKRCAFCACGAWMAHTWQGARDLFCIAFCVRVGKGWKNLLNQAFLAIPFGAANTPVHAKKLDNSKGFVLEYDE